MTVLLDLVRHGETVTPGHLIGRTDPPLSDRGAAQFSRQVAGRSWDGIIASPRLRTRTSAEALAAERGIALRIDDDWRELDFGDWDGRSLEELHADRTTAEAVAAFYRDADAPGAPGGEDWRMLEGRVARALGRLLTPPAPRSALVVTHGGPMRAAIAITCALPFANLWTFRIEPGTRITLRIGRDGRAGLWGEIVEVVQP